MKKNILNVILIVVCGGLLAGMAFVVPIEPTKRPATVSLRGPIQVRIGEMFTLSVQADLTDVTLPGGQQPAALGSYVIPVTFDPSVLQFIAAGGGESPAFAAGPTSVTSAVTANTSGVVTLVGSQTVSDAVTGVVAVATVSFSVIAVQPGSTTVGIRPALASPGLSLATAVPLGGPNEPTRLAAVNQASVIEIVR